MNIDEPNTAAAIDGTIHLALYVVHTSRTYCDLLAARERAVHIMNDEGGGKWAGDGWLGRGIRWGRGQDDRRELPYPD